MHSLLFIILSTLLYRVSFQSQSSSKNEIPSTCGKHLTCFDCFSSNKNCTWINQTCIQLNSLSSVKKAIDSLIQCEKEDPTYIQQTYSDICQGMNNNNIPLYANISQNENGTFGINNTQNNNDIIYCLWNVFVSKLNKKVSIYLTITDESYESKDGYQIEIINKDNSSDIILLDSKQNFVYEKKGIREIKFRYFGNSIKQHQPFLLTIQYMSSASQINSIKLFIIIFVSFIGMVLIGCFIFCLYEKLHKKKENETLDTNIGNKTQETKSHFCFDKNKFILVYYDNEMKLRETNCTICLEIFLLGTKVLQLACGHYYHIHCIVKWIEQFSKQIPKCPNCNEEIKSFAIETRRVDEYTKRDGDNNDVSCRRDFIYKYKYK